MVQQDPEFVSEPETTLDRFLGHRDSPETKELLGSTGYNNGMEYMPESAPVPAPENNGSTRWFFLLVYALVVAAVIRVMLPFGGALISAAVAASLLSPLYRHLRTKFPRYQTVAAVGSIITLTITVCVPLVVTILVFVSRLPDAIKRAREALSIHQDFLQPGGAIYAVFDKLGLEPESAMAQLIAFAQTMLNEVLHWLSSNATSVVGAGGGMLLSFLVFMVALYMFLSNSSALIKWLMELSPLDVRLEQKLIEIFVAYSKALVVGSFFTASLQGLVAWIAYLSVGLQEAFLLGVATTFGSFIPAVGSALIWGPAALYLMISEGRILAGLALIFVGVFVIGGIDSTIKPFFYKSSYQVHPFLIFLSMLGGLFWLGFWGLLLGPVLTAFMLTLHSFSVEHKLFDL